MKPESASNASGTEPTSRNAPEKILSEADYLTRQATDAAAAIAHVATKMKAEFASGVDPRVWAETHPWPTVAAAAVAGFAAAVLLVPSKEQQALRRLAAIEKALLRETHDESSNGDGEYAREKPTFLSGLAREILGAVKPAILSMLTAGITAKATKPTPEEIHNAAHGDTTPPEAGPDASGDI